MPAGYQEWDAAGNLIVDTPTKIGRMLNVVTLSGAVDGSETNDGLLTGDWFCQVVFLGNYSTFMPTITVVGNEISWAWGGRGSGNTYRLIYGVY